MARPPLMQISDVALGYGGDPLFADLSVVIHEGDRLALVGRNGAGKSTLMKVMAGLAAPDAGEVAAPNASVGYMEQDPAMDGHATLGDWALKDLGPAEAWRLDAAAEGLGFDPARPVATASGGERRRAALAKLFAEAPEVMLLDEPTNHLDIAAIAWVEGELSRSRAAWVAISHDRALLRAAARGVLWIDRGAVRRMDRGFDAFEDWRDATWAEEDLARHKLDRRIKAEARWAVEGISARRKRNQGRVRALREMQAGRAAQVRRQGAAALALEVGETSGKRVIEARGIAKAYGGAPVLRPFDLRVMRGDRVALVGPNGAGKTTLLRMLTGDLAPDEGAVTHGTGVEIAYLDQQRAALSGDLTLWETLANDPEIGVSGRADQVMVRGAPRHVVGYLKDFLFDDGRVRAPVRSLSGGERARLLLAKLFARQSNLLVLDEPTNDLDVETLDLLQDVLGEYPGTVLVVSHDRDFLDRIATSTVALTGGGHAIVFAGGWSDLVAQNGGVPEAMRPRQEAAPRAKATKPAEAAPRAAAPQGLSFTERHRLEKLPAVIERLEAEIVKLTAFLGRPGLYDEAPAKFAQASEALGERQTRLAEAEAEWLDLEERAAG